MSLCLPFTLLVGGEDACWHLCIGTLQVLYVRVLERLYTVSGHNSSSLSVLQAVLPVHTKTIRCLPCSFRPREAWSLPALAPISLMVPLDAVVGASVPESHDLGPPVLCTGAVFHFRCPQSMVPLSSLGSCSNSRRSLGSDRR